jgi:hypothetical protein
MIMHIQGSYRDAVTDSQGRVQWSSSWRSNLIVHDCSVLLAALLKRHRGLRGILYWAVGEGKKEWDALCPSPRLSDSRLAVEIRRQAPDRIVYLDDAGQPSRTPTSCLEVTAAFKGQDLVRKGFRSLREFGLFGGDATEAPDSGFMIDYVIHPRIDLSPTDKLERKLRLTFASGAVQLEEKVGGFGAAPPVTISTTPCSSVR